MWAWLEKWEVAWRAGDFWIVILNPLLVISLIHTITILMFAQTRCSSKARKLQENSWLSKQLIYLQYPRDRGSPCFRPPPHSRWNCRTPSGRSPVYASPPQKRKNKQTNKQANKLSLIIQFAEWVRGCIYRTILVDLYRREGVAGVGDEHARLPDGPVPDGHALDESRGAHPSTISPNPPLPCSLLCSWCK